MYAGMDVCMFTCILVQNNNILLSFCVCVCPCLFSFFFQYILNYFIIYLINIRHRSILFLLEYNALVYHTVYTIVLVCTHVYEYVYLCIYVVCNFDCMYCMFVYVNSNRFRVKNIFSNDSKQKIITLVKDIYLYIQLNIRPYAYSAFN